jgi:hypothetical protein
VKGTFLGLTAAALALMGSAAHADSITLGSPLSGIHPLGLTENYALDGTTFTASGFDATSTATDLSWKNDGGDEVGLGLNNDTTTQGEIEFKEGFVQLNIGVLRAAGFSNLGFTTGSTSADEEWAVYGSNTAGVCGSGYSASTGTCGGSALVTGFTEGQSPAILFPGTFTYYDFVEIGDTTNSGCTTGTTCTDNNDNFLIASITGTPRVTVPEPITLSIFGFGLAGAVVLRRRKKA